MKKGSAPPTKKRKFGPKTELSEISTLKKKVSKLEREVEWKYSDVDDAGTVRGTVSNQQGELTYLNSSAQDTAAAFGRIGTQITAKKLDIAVTVVSGNIPVTDYPQVHRVMLFWDKSANGAFPPLYNVGTGSGAYSLLDNRSIAITYAPLNHGSRKRFKVLWDKRFVVAPSSSQALIQGVVTFTKSIKLYDRKCEYQDATTGNISDITTNSLIFVIMNDSGNDDAQYQVASRFWYSDE